MKIYPERFDLIAKYLYIKYYEKKIKCDFYIELYHKHLLTFNNCSEPVDPNLPNQKLKQNISNFINSFNFLINDMKNNGFNEKYPIPLGKNNIIINGSHRLMVSYYFNINPTFINIENNGSKNYNFNFFANRKKGFPNLDLIYTDTIALEYIKHNKNLRAMVIYPIANHKNNIFNIINQYGYIYYMKRINLNYVGVNNLIKELYRGEEWIGGLFPKGISNKTRKCITNKLFPTILILISMNDIKKLIELKEKCRKKFNLGKHSLHMTDYQEDTYRVGCSLLNKNSIHFLNYGTNDIADNSKNLLIRYFNEIKNEPEDYCITSSIIMEMYGLRKANDLDYLHFENIELKGEKINCHKGKWLKYYHINKDDIIYNPKYHFYCSGYKFITLNVLKEMKKKRGEEKDIKDIIIINKTFRNI
jgi:hypothetical protein